MARRLAGHRSGRGGLRGVQRRREDDDLAKRGNKAGGGWRRSRGPGGDKRAQPVPQAGSAARSEDNPLDVQSETRGSGLRDQCEHQLQLTGQVPVGDHHRRQDEEDRRWRGDP